MSFYVLNCVIATSAVVCFLVMMSRVQYEIVLK